MTPSNEAKNIFDGSKLARFRRARGLTQKQLAEKAGLNVVTIQRFEQGRADPTQETIKKVCEVLGIQSQDIVTEEFASAGSEWIPCSIRPAEFPCIACDQFGHIFIPNSIIGLETDAGAKCYATNSLDDIRNGLNVGNGMRIFPPEIIAWMPLPAPYKETDA